MSNRLATLMALALLSAGWLGWERLPGMLRSMEAFQVRAVELEGGSHLSRDEAVAQARIPAGSSIWDDPEPWESALADHPLVRVARVERKFPSTLVLVVEERQPVALLSTPTLEPIDEEGHLLPIDPAVWPLDLPLLRVEGSGASEVRALAREMARIGRVEPAFLSELSAAAVDAQGNFVARWGGSDVTFLFAPNVPARRLREGVRALEDATLRQTGSAPESIDLRWDDQVVVQLR